MEPRRSSVVRCSCPSRCRQQGLRSSDWTPPIWTSCTHCSRIPATHSLTVLSEISRTLRLGSNVVRGPSRERAFAWYGLWLRTGTFVGTCGLLLSERCAPEPEIGYEIARPMRGRGLAREAAEAVTEAAHEFGVPRLWATVRTGNQASMRILSSLGYLEEHTEPDDRGALAYLYSIPDEGPTA